MASSQPMIPIHVSLQELAKEFKVAVPDRYVQEHREPTIIFNGSSPLPSIPVIDLKDFIKMLGKNDDNLKSLRSVCQEWGIFQVKYLYKAQTYVQYHCR